MRAEPGLEPLAAGDLTILASDCGPAPMHIAAVLLLDGADDGTWTVPATLAQRARQVPRLTQVLVRAGRGTRPAWRLDPDADPATHVLGVRLAGGGERAVLDETARLLATRLDPARPLWAARWLTGWDGTGVHRAALVVVLHHVLADGLGGLGVLRALADPDDAPVPDPPTHPTARTAPRPRDWVHGLLELLGGGQPLVVARTSLNRPTGARRRLGTLDVPLAAFHDGARRAGGTVNDGVVAAVVGALTGVLRRRGERPHTLVVSVPVTGRPAGDHRSGNDSGVLPVAVPTGLDTAARVRRVAAATARRKARPRGRSALPLGAAFRGLAAVGLIRPFVEHQRLVHTFETNVRGPARPLRIAGREVSAVLPAAANAGNVGVSFAALSYAGRLVVTVVADPLLVPEADALVGLLARELESIAGAGARTW
jgi:hypothetical protein